MADHCFLGAGLSEVLFPKEFWASNLRRDGIPIWVLSALKGSWELQTVFQRGLFLLMVI